MAEVGGEQELWMTPRFLVQAIEMPLSELEKNVGRTG